MYKKIAEQQVQHEYMKFMLSDFLSNQTHTNIDDVMLTLNPNVSTEFIVSYPNLPWNWSYVTSQRIDGIFKIRKLPINFIRDNINRHWNWDDLSLICISYPEFVLENINYNWNFHKMSKEQDVFYLVTRNPSLPWNWESISLYQNNISSKVLKYPDFPWDWNYVSMNINITFEDVIALHESSYSSYIDWNTLSNNKNVVKYAIEFPNLPWKWYMVSKHDVDLHLLPYEIIDKHVHWKYASDNVNLTTEFIAEHIDRRWNWRKLSENESVTAELVSKFINKPWDWTSLSYRPEIIFELYQKYPKKKLDINCIIRNPRTTWDHVVTNDWVPWNYSYLSGQNKVMFDFIEKHPDKPWNWALLSMNNNLKPEFVTKTSG